MSRYVVTVTPLLACSMVLVWLAFSVKDPALPMPGPTRTPWVQTRVVEVRRVVTPTETATATPAPWQLTMRANALTPHPTFPLLATETPVPIPTSTVTPFGRDGDQDGGSETGGGV